MSLRSLLNEGDQETADIKDAHEFAGDHSFGEFEGHKLVHAGDVLVVAPEGAGVGGESSSDDFPKV